MIEPEKPRAPGGRISLSLGVSIVLYRTPVQAILPLLQALRQQGARLIYLIDNSPKEFDAFQGWSPPTGVITVSVRKNLGYGRAHNLAVRDSVRRHKYHLICNPDVDIKADTLAVLSQMMDERTDVGLCLPRVVGPDGVQHYLCKRAPSPIDFLIRRFAPRSWFAKHRAHFEMRDHSYDEEMEATFLSGCFMFFRCDVLARIDGFDERFFLYLEDADLSRRSQRVARNLYYPMTKIVHAHQRGAYKSLRLFSYFTISIVRYFNKWGWFEQRWFR